MRVARSELILGAEAAGKMARAEALAQAWVAAQPGRRAVYVDTAQGWDSQMRALIERHRDGSGAGGRMITVEEPTELAHALGAHSRPDTLIVVDCLTFWLTATLMQALEPDHSGDFSASDHARPPVRMFDAVRACAGPLVLVSHQLHVAPAIGRHDLNALLDTLDTLDQQAVGACERVTLMSAGMPLTLKEVA
ncbi:MAG TPA: bifunctional adenosylcobinamide kinase/adenosylcobinamide-phosphate guanylyltransferase [Ramlibacter sp.]|nr:bifunctional adenosylcobinamide kinase/adenosylcobinamide-phosphate guanylyltransferase [Ramlibacter sp.]